MRLISLKRLFMAVLALSIVTACKKDDFSVEDEGSFGNITYFAKASGAGVKKVDVTSDKTLNSAIPNSTMNSVAVEWSSATIYVEKIAFVGKNNTLLDTTIFVGKNIDMFNANALAGMIQLPTGSYKDVKVKLFCLKSDKSELAFDLKGTFINTKGGKDNVRVGSSFPFEANLDVTDIIVNSSDEYTATFTFNLDKVLSGISTESLQTARSYTEPDNSIVYVIWKGGSDEEPFYDQVIENWQTVASVAVSKK